MTLVSAKISISRTHAVLIACLTLSHDILLADQAKMFSVNPDPQELAEYIFSDESDSDESRSWMHAGAPPPTNVAALKILFEFDSNEITPTSIETISRLAQALKSAQAENKPILIEGHTDTTGDASYNVDLSKRRAQTVKDYLVDSYGIAQERLFIEGLGETQLFTPDFPAASINRRVQVKQHIIHTN